MEKVRRLLVVLLSVCCSQMMSHAAVISGTVVADNGQPVDYASVVFAGTSMGCFTDADGWFSMEAPAGNYQLHVSSLGFRKNESKVSLSDNNPLAVEVVLASKTRVLDEVEVVSNAVSRVQRSAFNAVALDTKVMENTSQNLSDLLSQAPGMKLRESGGVGSDMQLMMDGFSGKHIKVFIDGVPQEGVGSSFSLNNIPVNFAERIEVYRGVVPVGFGTDAIGGVINIITKKKKDRWFLDASYSYGSFNTHKSFINFGQTFKNGLMYEVNLFQNYSDNNYKVETPVKDFATGAINMRKKETVERFHDMYHNEAVVAKVGIVGKSWADRLAFGFTASNMHKDIQTGVRQEVVFGAKYREGYSLMPSVEYRKRDLLTKGLDVMLTGNYNHNITNNVDTSNYEYNWRGEIRPLRTPGEQSYQFLRSANHNWNATATVNYRIGNQHLFTFNHVFNSFRRNNMSLLDADREQDAIPKETVKNIGGLSYRFMPNEKWNASAFGKYYRQFMAGPMATSTAQDEFVRTTRDIGAMGYGVAGTYFVLPSLQAKVSYEKAYRLPTNEEMFGDEDLETGDLTLRPENSDNVNLNISFSEKFHVHSLYVDGGLIYRDTKDYIQRKITSLSGGKYGAAYVNHGRVLTKGFTLSARYGFSKWLSVGGNFTQMDIRDHVRTVSAGSSQESLTYGERMPNVPYRFANSDVTFYWNDLFGKGNKLTVTYDNLYMHSFPLYSEALGSESDYVVPTQFSHNLSVSYSVAGGRYNFSVECRNLTNEKLYDNFSLQKAGRAFYGKVRISLGN